MKLLFTLLAAALSITPALSKPKSAVHGYPINPVPFTSVKVTPGTFWGQRLEASRKVTIPLAFAKCEETDLWSIVQSSPTTSLTSQNSASVLRQSSEKERQK